MTRGSGRRPDKARRGRAAGLVALLVAAWALGLTPRAVQPALAQGTGTPGAADNRTRAAFLQLIERPRVPLAPAVTALPSSGRSSQEHFTFASEAGERVPGIVVKPAGPGRHATVIALHGTGGEKEDLVPLLRAFADRGLVGVAIDGRFHGERAKNFADYPNAIARAFASGQGHPFLYDTVWDVMRLIDYLSTRPDVDPARIGLMGISKGGMETYLAAAVDPRVAVAIPIIGVQSFRWALDHNSWQPRVGTIQPAVDRAAAGAGSGVTVTFVRRFYDRVVPGIYGEFDGPAMLPLIAPRPLLVINGDQDSLTPVPGVQEAAAAAGQAYRLAGADDRFALFWQPDTGHDYIPEAQRRTLDWLVKWLRP